MNRFVFWCLVAITCTTVFFGVRDAASLTGTIMSTTGNVGGVVVGSAPDLVQGFRDGIGSGSGDNGNSIFKTFDQQQQPRRGQVQAQQRGPREVAAKRDRAGR